MPSQQAVAIFDGRGVLMGLQGERAGKIWSVGQDQRIQTVSARYVNKFKRGVSIARAIGDSWTLNNGASAYAKGWEGLIEGELSDSFVFQNYGFGGRALTSYLISDGYGAAMPLLATVQTKIDDVVFGIIGLNDLRGVGCLNSSSTQGAGPNPENWPQLRRRLRALVTRMLIPETSRVRAKTLNNSGMNPAVMYSGTWSVAAIGGSSNVVYSTSQTVGTKLELTSTPGDFMVIRYMSASGASAVYAVRVDGVIVGYLTSKAEYDTQWAYECATFKLKKSAAHAVAIEWVSGDNIVFDSCDCVDTSEDFSATMVYSTPGYLPTTAGLGWDSTMVANSSIANASVPAYLLGNGGADRFGDVINSVMNELYDIGFNVVDVRHRTTFNPALHLGPDKVHPNDYGHADIFSHFMGAMSKLAGKV